MKCPNCGEKDPTGVFCSACGWMAPPKVLAIRGFRRITLGVFTFSLLFLETALNWESYSSTGGLLYLMWGLVAVLITANGVSLLREARRDVTLTGGPRIGESSWYRFLTVLAGMLVVVDVIGLLLDRHTLLVASVFILVSIFAMYVFENLEIRKKRNGFRSGQSPSD